MNQKQSDSIKIRVDQILDEFGCTICFVEMTDATITKCGHSFCKGCIEEWINRNHQCPTCKQKLQVQDLIKNYHFDQIIRFLVKEQESEKKKYFENLVGDGPPPKGQEDNLKLENPLQQVFLKNMKSSLLQFQKYRDDLQKDKQKLLNSLQTAAALKEMQPMANKTQIQLKLQKEKNEIEGKFFQTVMSMVQCYDDYMQKAVPTPNLLPKQVRLILKSKGVTIQNALVKIHENVGDLIPLIEQYFAALGDEVTMIDPNIKAIVREPFSEEKEGEEIKDSHELLIDKSVSFQQINLKPRSEIIIMTEIQTKSDMPKKCMSFDFKKGAGAQYDYYTCVTCNINCKILNESGVCQGCKDGCHLGHQMKEYLKDHVPSWACCYCVKRGFCKIPNAKKK